MEVITYSDIVRRVVSYAQRVYSELSTDDADAISVYLDTRMKLIWEYYSWPDLVRVEKRYFRQLYVAGTTYEAGTEVYYPTEDKYYQALKQTSGNVPTLTAFWAESKQTYSGDLWQAGASYSVGDIIEYASDGLFYACHTAHTSSGTLIPNATGGNERWGKLTELDKYVAWKQAGENEITDVLEVYNSNPRTNKKSDSVNFFQSENGVQIINGPNIVYVEYRQIVPDILYKTWASGSSYALNDVVRFPATGPDFDLYKASSAHTSSGSNEPTDTNAPWTIIQIPRDFRSFLSHGAAADMLLSDEREQLGGIQNSLADKSLRELLDKLERQEKQTKQMNVITR